MKTTRLLKLFAGVLALGLVISDHIIKQWAFNALRLSSGGIEVIPGLFNLTYVENRGAAFGILQGNTFMLSIVAGVVMLAGICYVYLGKVSDRFIIYTVMLIIAGGCGNWIDRVFRGFVVDYLDFSALFGFPVFNLADCCVVIGAFSLLIYIMAHERLKAKIAPEAE